jgi:cytoskeletal protein CcmA (bactofilin family)
MKRATKVVLGGLGGLVTLLVAGGVGAGLWVTSDAGERFVADKIEQAVANSLAAGDVRFGSLDLDLSGLVATDVVVDGAEHERVVHIERVEADWRLRSLFARTVALSRVEVVRPTVLLPRRDDGSLDLPQPTDSEGPSQPGYLPGGWTVSIDRLVLRDGAVTLPDDGVQGRALNATGPVVVGSEHVDAELVASWAQAAPDLGRPSARVELWMGLDDLTATAELWREGQGLRGSVRAADALSDREPALDGWAEVVSSPSALRSALAAAQVDAELPEGVQPVRLDATLQGALSALATDVQVAWVPRANWNEAGLGIASAQTTLDVPGSSAVGTVQAADLTALRPLGLPDDVAGDVTVEGQVRWGEAVEAEAVVRSDGLVLPGAELGSLVAPASVQVSDAGDVDVRADVVAEAVSVAGQARAGRVLADVELSLADGSPYGTVSARVPSLVVAVPDQPDASLSLTADLWARGDAVGGSVRARDRDDDDLRLDLDAVMDLDSQTVRASTVAIHTGPETTFANREPWRFRIVGDGVSDLSADLYSEHGGVVVQAERLSPSLQEGRASLDELHLGPLRRVAERYAELPPLEGVLRGDVTFSHGDGVRPALVADVQVDRFRADDTVEALDLALDGRVAGDRLKAELAVTPPSGRERLLTARVDAPLAPFELYVACDEGATVELDVPKTEWEQLTALSEQVPRIGDETLRPGSVWAQLRSTGDLCDPQTVLTAGATATYDQRPMELELLLEDAPDADHTLRLTSGVSLEGTTRAVALADLRHEPLYDLLFGESDWDALLHDWSGELKALGVPADLVSSDLEGRLYGRAEVQGTGTLLQTTRGEAKMVELAMGDTPVDARARWSTDERGMAEGAVAIDVPDTDGVDLRGSIDLLALQRPDEPVPFEVRLADASFPLEALAALTDGAVVDAEGALLADGVIQGTLDDPRGDLSLKLSGGDLTLADTGVRYTDIDLTARVDGLRLVVDELTMGSRPRYGRYALERTGTDLSGRGVVALDQGAVTSDLTFDFDQLWVLSNSTGLAEVKGSLAVRGAYPTLDVDGDVEVVDGRFDLERHLFVSKADIEVDEQIVFVDGTPERLRGLEEEDQVAVAEELDVNVNVDLGRRVSLSATVPLAADAGALGSAADVNIDADVSGELDVALDDGEPSAQGQIDTEGSVDLFTADFDIQQGAIRFSGGDVTNPNLNFTLVRSGGSYGDVRARVVGTPDDLQIVELTSDDYADQADVMAILLFGRPLSELDAGEGQTGGELVQTALLAAAGSRVEDALGADLVDSVSYDADDGLALGWSIGTDAFLTVAVDPTAEPDENLTEARLSYFIGRAAEAEVQTGDAGASEAWLRVEERF